MIPTHHQIIEVVCARTGVPVSELLSRSRAAEVTGARALACWIMRSVTIMSFPEVRDALHLRSHATVIKARDQWGQRIRRESVVPIICPTGRTETLAHVLTAECYRDLFERIVLTTPKPKQPEES